MENSINDLDQLLPEESLELGSLLLSFFHARANQEYRASDELRNILLLWDETLGVTMNKGWFPIFESNINRRSRAFNRMKKYNVDVYPWTLQEITND